MDIQDIPNRQGCQKRGGRSENKGAKGCRQVANELGTMLRTHPRPDQHAQNDQPDIRDRARDHRCHDRCGVQCRACQQGTEHHAAGNARVLAEKRTGKATDKQNERFLDCPVIVHLHHDMRRIPGNDGKQRGKKADEKQQADTLNDGNLDHVGLRSHGGYQHEGKCSRQR